MNNKRQTIWLVSMLSLMVVLSAYYLFTGDSGTSKIPVADSQQVVDQKSNENKELVTEVVVDGQNSDHTETPKTTDTVKKSDDTTVATDTLKETDKAVTKDTSKDTTKVTAKKETTKSTEAKNDDEVLKEVASQATSGRSILDSYQLERKDNSMKKQSDLYALLNETNTPEEVAKANDELRSLDEKESKITGIEEALHQQFEEVVVKEENDKYQVLVLSDKLDVKQAVNIVQLVMKELNVSQDKVSVQHVAP
ncbi:SpoIIIAH-like family protein [Paenibacillus macquariensis]|uniref:Stage III sporulation protein AH n=1 Tax=Paenibacillus macquariensis TaxID=948756 RepID=A0ABY1JKK6_9BACL|nr:SpoIIIAH-like family protein [Paenibacillus macquariensis]MEC0089952.1 SpoIIIAH-like family protein [Paenibacillus macquariensis]OAB31159.1 hypothetical protein PMSM_20790 [Paenibacillus macquariensis subsp. macquariensis]SIQ34922.1 stage III sporulation protein AH [Paenibacillus macquariensis]